MKAGEFRGGNREQLGGMTDVDGMIQKYIDRSELGSVFAMLQLTENGTDRIDDQSALRVVGPVVMVARPATKIRGAAVAGGGGPASGSLKGPIEQILTETAFVDIEYPTMDEGTENYSRTDFIIRMWPRTPDITKVGIGADRTPLPAIPPVHEARFSPGKIVEIERFGASGEYATCQIKSTEGPVSTVNTHLGTDETGPVIRREIIRHSDRGNFIWDVTLEKELHEAATLPGGAVGPLVKVSHSKEVYGDYSQFSYFSMVPTPGDEYTSGVSITSTFKGGRRDGRRLKTMIEDFGGTNLTTTYSYDEAGGSPYDEKRGRLLSIRYPDGSWLKNVYLSGYDVPVAAVASTRTWLDFTSTSGVHVETTTLTEKKHLSKTIKVAGQPVATTTLNGEEITKQSTDFHVDISGGGLVERRHLYPYEPDSVGRPGERAGRPNRIIHKDGTLTTWRYLHHVAGQIVAEPAPESADSGQIIVKRTGAPSADGKTVVSGIETTTTYNRWLQMTSEEEKDIATGALLSSKVADLSYGLDGLMRPMKFIYNGDPDDHSIEKRTCCGITFSRDRTGATTDYAYDGLKRPYRIVEKASSTSPEVITHITYHGGTTTTHRTSGGVTLFVEEVTKNLLGDIISRKTADEDGDGQPEETTYATTYPGIEGSGNKTRTTTYPDGSTKIEKWYRDGRIKSITGTAVPDVHYTYGTHDLNGGGIWTQVTQGSPTGSEWTRTYADSLEREFKVEYPDGATLTRTYYSADAPAGSRGKLATTTDPDGVTTSYSYDAEGEIATVTEAMPGGQERVTSTDTDVVNDPQLGAAWRTRKWINGVLVSTDFASSDGRGTRSESLGVITAWSETLPADGAWTTATLTGDGQKLIKTYAEGRLSRSEFFDNQDQSVSWTSWTYDAFGRVLTETDSRTGTATRGAYTDSGNLLSSADAGGRATAWGYDVMGRTTLIDQPDTTDAGGNPIGNITRTAYHPTGEIQAVWGDQTNPTYRVYDERNRLTQLRTYRGIAHGTRPLAGTGGYDPTTWTYHSQRGWLVAKRDAADKGADYTYTPAGRLLTRQWARTTGSGSRLTTTYGYDSGKLVSTSYNDGTTPGVTYAYDALGRQTQVTQAGNSWTYAYDPATLLLHTETVVYDTDNDGTGDFTRVLDRSRDARLRPTGYQLKDGAAIEAAAAYTYDDSGRLHTVRSVGVPPTSSPDQTFTYAYEAHSHLVKTVTGPAHTVANTWDATRDALLSKENKVGTTEMWQPTAVDGPPCFDAKAGQASSGTDRIEGDLAPTLSILTLQDKLPPI